MGLKFSSSGSLAAAFKAKRDVIAAASTAAMKATAEAAVSLGRADIAGAGFSRKWQNALQATVYPKNRDAVSPAAVVTLRIPYASVFEEGATIRGKPLLWLPLPTVKQFRITGKPTPAKFIAAGFKLFSIERAGKKPLLAVPGRGPRDRAVPVFVGVPDVNIRQRLHIARACANAAQRLQAFYAAALKDV